LGFGFQVADRVQFLWLWFFTAGYLFFIPHYAITPLPQYTLLEGCDHFSVPGTSDLNGVFHAPEMQALGDTLGDTGWFKPLINTIHAIVAFNHLATVRIPLGGTPGARRHTGLAAYAKGCIHEYDAVLGPFLHGPGRAGGYAPGFFTVKTGHENVGRARQVVDHFRPHGNDLSRPGTHGQVLVGLAVHFTAVAPNATFGVLK
jgi:hypothetical protein